MNPYRDTSTIEAEAPDQMETDFNLLHQRIEHAIRASFFCGGMFGLLALAIACLVQVLRRG